MLALIVAVLVVALALSLALYTVLTHVEDRQNARDSMRGLDGYAVETQRERELPRPVRSLPVAPAHPAVADAPREFGSRGWIGVGTILDVDTCRAALDAGAQYVVSPIVRPELVEVAHAAGRPVMLGAYTPTEAQLAHEAGSDFIKIFPADGLGPNYIKALRAPLPHLRIVPTGGVDLNTAADFPRAGCVALGVGSSLVSARILQEDNWSALTRVAREFARVVTEFLSAR